MFLATTVQENLGIVDAAVIAVLGYAIVFFGLILLMAVIVIMGRFFMSKGSKPAVKKEPVPEAAAPVAVPAAPVIPAVSEPAPGSAGKLKLHDVEPKTAAMLMAIVANKMGKPLNELRFISIKEVK